MPAADPAVVFPDLARRLACGAAVIFLTTDTYARAAETTGWLPLRTKGRVAGIARWLYHADDWARRHPIFEGLPAGGLMDDDVYREIIPDVVLTDIDPAGEAVAGAINASWGYQSGLTLAIYRLGAGRFIVNTLKIRENLGKVPQADRLLLNMLRFASGAAGPLVELPPSFDETLKAWGY
jgi:hypothetical protein